MIGSTRDQCCARCIDRNFEFRPGMGFAGLVVVVVGLVGELVVGESFHPSHF